MTTIEVTTKSGELNPKFFLANEWAKDWCRRMVLAAMDGHHAAVTLSEHVPSASKLFATMSQQIGEWLDALTAIEHDYRRLCAEADRWSLFAADNSSMLVSLCLHQQWAAMVKASASADVDDAIALARSCEAAVRAAAHARRRWTAEHYKVFPF